MVKRMAVIRQEVHIVISYQCHFERYMALSCRGLAVAQPYHEERPAAQHQRVEQHQEGQDAGQLHQSQRTDLHAVPGTDQDRQATLLLWSRGPGSR